MKTPPKRKTVRKPMGITIDTKIKAQLDTIREEQGIPLNRQIELALQAWIAERWPFKGGAR